MDSVSSGCPPGVERGRLVDDGRLSERRLSPEDLLAAEGLAVVNLTPRLPPRRPALTWATTAG